MLFVYFSFLTHFPLVWSAKHLTRHGGHTELFYLLKERTFMFLKVVFIANAQPLPISIGPCSGALLLLETWEVVGTLNCVLLVLFGICQG